MPHGPYNFSAFLSCFRYKQLLKLPLSTKVFRAMICFGPWKISFDHAKFLVLWTMANYLYGPWKIQCRGHGKSTFMYHGKKNWENGKLLFSWTATNSPYGPYQTYFLRTMANSLYGSGKLTFSTKKRHVLREQNSKTCHVSMENSYNFTFLKL